MSTPSQYIPPEFQNEIDLPEAGHVDQHAVSRANSELAKYKRWVAANKTSLASFEAKKRATRDAKKKLYYNAQIAKIKRSITTYEGRQVTAQNQVYEVTGQYDKLLRGANRDAYLALKSLFEGFGLGSLAGKIFDYTKQGYGADTISILLQDTTEYKKRFAGNEARTRAGLPVLSPAEYLSTEQSYRQILQDAGLPKGFYDNPADFQRWIAGDVSPTEIKSRVDLAVQNTTQANPAVKQALAQMYGIDESHLTAYFLDRSTALPLLQKQATAAQIGAAALRRGFSTDRSEFENYATYGLTGQQAEQGFGQIAETYEAMGAIARRFGTDWTQRQAEHEVFEPGLSENWQPYTAETAIEKGKRLRSQERALFSGSRGTSAGGLSAGYRQT